MVAAASKPSLRERKKQRTRESIVDSATRLFTVQGYDGTTLAQVAEDADVATSTFFNYFPTKVDIVFCVLDAVIESARSRIEGRPEAESAVQAISAWLTADLPSVEMPYAQVIPTIGRIIESSPELAAEQRLRLAKLEDVLAAGFARDFGETPDGMRSRVMGAMALGGMLDAWSAWLETHASDAELHLSEALAAKAEYVVRVLEQGMKFIDLLPGPNESA